MDGHSFPKALAALVHHIQLTQSGWRERALEYVVQLTLYQYGKPCPKEQLIEMIEKNMPIPIAKAQIESKICELLLGDKSIVEFISGNLALSAKIQTSIQDKEKQSIELEQRVKAIFNKHFLTFQMEPKVEWEEVDKALIIPLVSELGAQTYEFLAGELTEITKLTAFSDFITQIPESYKIDFCERMATFLMLPEIDIKAYLIRLLNASFLVHATALSESTIAEIYKRTQSRMQMSIIVDTNFLFSLIKLHENPADDVVIALKAIIESLRGKIDIGLFVLPVTIREAERTLANYSSMLSGIALRSELISAALSRPIGYSGITAKYLRVASKSPTPLSAENYFRPYIDDLLRIAQEEGINPVDEPTDYLKMDYDVIQDCLAEIEFEKARGVQRPKSYETMLHDVSLWHYVNRKRPTIVESPIDAKIWAATIDFSLISFDRNKMRVLDRKIPVCIHPTVLMQILQFWVPRTTQYENAIISSLLPLLPHSFDKEAEDISIKIIKTISRYKNASDLSAETITNILVNAAVRTRMGGIADQDIQNEIVRDAIIDENKRLELSNRSLQEEKHLALGRIDKKDKKINELEKIIGDKEKEVDARIQRMRDQVKEEREKRTSIEKRIRDIELDRERIQEKALIRRAHVGFIIVGIIGCIFVTWFLLFLKGEWLHGLIINHPIINPIADTLIALTDIVSIIWIGKFKAFSKAKPFINRIRKWLWIALSTIVLGVFTTYICGVYKIGI